MMTAKKKKNQHHKKKTKKKKPKKKKKTHVALKEEGEATGDKGRESRVK